MSSVNKCLSLLACLAAWLAHAPPVQADPPESPVPPGGYAVVVSDSATPLERRAGELLREGLGVGDSGLGAREGQRTIYVGVSLASMTLGRARATPVDWASLGGDGVAIFKAGKQEIGKAGNQSIVIAGGRPRGTVHGVVRFLEDRAGCRWWPDGTAMIPQQTVSRPGGRGLGGASDEPYELIGVPAFGGASMWPAAWALNDPTFGREQTLGGVYYVTTVAQQLDQPPTHADGSVCLSDGVLREAVIAAVRRDLEATYPRVKRVDLGTGYRVSGVGYRDEKTGPSHDCKTCANLTEASGSPAGVLVGFGNAVAEAVAEDYPEARIVLTFEGENAKPTSGLRAEPNLVIRWVHDPYKEGVAGEHRAADWPFLAELRGWAAVGGTLELVEPLVDGRDNLAPQGGLYDLGLRLRQAKAWRPNATGTRQMKKGDGT